MDSAGVATICPDKQSYIRGVLWSLTEEDEATLDRYEGVAKGCYRKAAINIASGKDSIYALVYLSNRDAYNGKNRSGYMDIIIRAAEQLSFDEE